MSQMLMNILDPTTISKSLRCVDCKIKLPHLTTVKNLGSASELVAPNLESSLVPAMQEPEAEKFAKV